MKIIAYLCISLLCFCHNSGGAASKANDNRQKNIEGNRAIVETAEENNVAPVPKKGDLKISVYQDNKLTATYIYDKNVFLETVYPNSEDDDNEIEENPNLKDFVDKTEADNQSYFELLTSKNIKIPFPEPIFGKISDTAKVLTLLDDDSADIKKETLSAGDKKTLKFTDINDYVRLYPSEIPNTVFETEKLKNYELILANDFLNKETYQFQKSKIVREYVYEENRLVKLTFTSVINGKTKSEEMRFEYEKFNPNQATTR